MHLLNNCANHLFPQICLILRHLLIKEVLLLYFLFLSMLYSSFQYNHLIFYLFLIISFNSRKILLFHINFLQHTIILHFQPILYFQKVQQPFQIFLYFIIFNKKYLLFLKFYFYRNSLLIRLLSPKHIRDF